jgi:hypothetical protein
MVNVPSHAQHGGVTSEAMSGWPGHFATPKTVAFGL